MYPLKDWHASGHMPTHPASQKVDRQQKLLTNSTPSHLLFHQLHKCSLVESINRAGAEQMQKEKKKNIRISEEQSTSKFTYLNI